MLKKYRKLGIMNDAMRIDMKKLASNAYKLDIFDETGHLDYNKMAALIQTQFSEEIIQSAISKSIVLRLAREFRKMTSNETAIPVLDDLPKAYFVGQNSYGGKKKTTTVGFKQEKMYAEEIAAISVMEINVLRDAQKVGVTKLIIDRIAEAIAAVIDMAVLFGVNKPDLWKASLVDQCEEAGAVVEIGASTYDSLLGVGGVISKVEQSGYRVNGHMASVAVKSLLRAVKDNVGQPLFLTSMQKEGEYVLDGQPITFADNEAFNDTDVLMITGDFRNLLYAIRDKLEVKIFESGTVTDVFGVEHNLIDEDKVAIRATMRLGVTTVNPKNRLNPTASRFPFAVLKAAEVNAASIATYHEEHDDSVDDVVATASEHNIVTEQQLNSMTIDQIKDMAAAEGYTVTGRNKADLVADFMAAQNAAAVG